MFKLIGLTAASIFTAEALVMLFLESLGDGLSIYVRVFLDSTLLLICVFPTLYLLIFKEMAEQIRLRTQAEQAQSDWGKSLELKIEERTARIQRANEDLLVEVQERARASMALRSALNEAQRSKEQLRAIINAVNDALVVINEQGLVQVVNTAAEAMFSVSLYDLQGKSLQDVLLPWAESPASLETFFSRENDDQLTFLLHALTANGEKTPVEMRFGTELLWEGEPATVLMFSS